jgi:predicted transcriptional regulator
MPDPNPIVAEDNETERELLYLLTGDDLPLWSIWDLARALDRGKYVKDTIRSLRRNGLVNQTSDGYVFATRAAFRMVQVVGQVG